MNEKEIQTLINKGRFFEAAEISRQIIPIESGNLRIKHLHAMALSKSGAPEQAAAMLEPIYREDPENPETAGILGGIYKGIFRKNQDPEYGRLAYETYLKNYQKTRSYYTGINAASMSALVGMVGQGRKIASEILETLDLSDFWQKATKAEAHLLLKEYETSQKLYVEIRKDCQNDWGKVETIFRQLWLLNHFIKVPTPILNLFKGPLIAAFIGHMIDHPSREVPRFPPDIEEDVRAAISSAIQSTGINIGYCSVACGADIIFAESMIEKGKEVSIYIPFLLEDFKRTSVSFAGESWERRLEKILESEHIHMLTNSAYNQNDGYFQLVGKSVLGSAIIRAESNETKPFLLSVLSNYDLQNKPGGTREMIRNWPYTDQYMNINIDPFVQAKQPLQKNTAPFPAENPIVDIVAESISHLLICYFDEAVEEELTQLIAAIEQLSANMISPSQIYSMSAERLVFMHSSISQLMEILELIQNIISNETRIGLHTGTFSDSTQELDPNDPHAQVALYLINNSTGKEPLATKNFASILAVESTEYRFEFGGLLKSESDLEYEIYRVFQK